ncbi:MAG: hypothetical protein WC997_11985 [Porticoccaceae bacterium]
MNQTNQLLCAHSALIFAVVMGIGWFFVPGWFPPIDPGMSAGEVQSMYDANRNWIRFGMTLAAFSSVFWWTLSAAIAMQMRRIEGQFPVLAWVQMGAATGTVLVVMFAAYFNLAVAYRPTTPDTSMQLLHDLAWLMMIGAWPPGFIQNVSIGLCILSDKGEKKIYPRWLGYANFWIAILYLPGAMLPFFHGGPFSWQGIFGFWLVANFFFLWIMLMWWYTVKAIKAQPTHAAPTMA